MLDSKFFKRKEFDCNCGCGFNAVDAELLKVLEDVRTHFGAPVTINSACRCPEYNAKVGGAPGSQHKLGKACDIVAKGIPTNVVADYLEDRYPNTYGVGRYSTFTHIDVRESKGRWHG